MNKETSLFQEKPTEFSFLKRNANLGEPSSWTKRGRQGGKGKEADGQGGRGKEAVGRETEVGRRGVEREREVDLQGTAPSGL